MNIVNADAKGVGFIVKPTWKHKSLFTCISRRWVRGPFLCMAAMGGCVERYHPTTATNMRLRRSLGCVSCKEGWTSKTGFENLGNRTQIIGTNIQFWGFLDTWYWDAGSQCNFVLCQARLTAIFSIHAYMKRNTVNDGQECACAVKDIGFHWLRCTYSHRRDCQWPSQVASPPTGTWGTGPCVNVLIASGLQINTGSMSGDLSPLCSALRVHTPSLNILIASGLQNSKLDCMHSTMCQ